MTEQEAMDLALFRYAVIGPLVANLNDGESKEGFYREAEKRKYTLPDGKESTFKAGTIKSWYLNYTKGGLQALKPRQRIDLGQSRALTPEIEAEILKLKEKFPRITGQKIWEKLIENGTIKPTSLSVDTVQRYLRKLHMNGSPGPVKEHLAFEFEHVNDCWQTDTVDGPRITDIEGQEHDTYLISIHDDHSRKNTKGAFYFADNAVNMQHTLKRAVKVCGVPKILIMDNGGSYRNGQFREISAELGIGAVYLKPYAPEGKGKEERSHRTMLMRFMDCTDFSNCHDLETLNAMYEEYINKDYNQAVNRMTGQSPNDRFMAEYDRVSFIDSERLDFIFMHRGKRRLNANSTIQFENKLYEVPQEYIASLPSRKKATIQFRYHPEDFSELYIVDEKNYKILYTLKPVNLTGNSRRKRGSSIDYSIAGV